MTARLAQSAALALLLAAAAWSQPRFTGRRMALRPGDRAIATPIPFRAVGAPGGLSVRASADGFSWTEWRAAEPDGGSYGLVYFGELQQYLEVRGEAAEVLLIDPGATPAAPRARSMESAPGAVPAPPIVTREQWGCTPVTCPAKDPPVYAPVTHLIVHHTAGANTATDWAAVVRSIWVLHVQGNGWNDVGYNYLVDPNGLLYEGRAGGDGVIGAHFSGVNTGTMGVSVLGTYSTVPIAGPALATLRDMLVWQAGKWKLDPAGMQLHASSALTLDVIGGHRDANLSTRATGATECPGNGLYPVLPALRSEVYALLAGGCPVTLWEQNRCAPSDGGVISAAVGAPAGCLWTAVSNASWVAARATASGVDLEIQPNDGARRSGAASIGGHLFTITQSARGEGPLPCVAFRGVMSAAPDTGRPAVAGSLISIYGSGFAPSATVAIDGRAARILYAGPNQINAQVPAGTNIGSARAVVTANGVAGPEAMFSVTEAVPAIFLAQNYEDGRLNAPAAPVRPGAPLIVYLTGAGAPPLPWSAAIGGRAAGLLFLGPSPEFGGVDQANLVVPPGLPPGDYPLVITVSGAPSTPLTVTVGR